ncbi:hypothetical protein BURPS305_5745 [Burkholderia pseudomallei 305]|nr:hypothetical protein BURPS305_5745 [Burkholderia pseudomallei 305]
MKAEAQAKARGRGRRGETIRLAARVVRKKSRGMAVAEQ